MFSFIHLNFCSRSNTILSGNDLRKQQNINIARRLITIAITDFLCWCPVGLIGMLAWNGIKMPMGVNQALVTFVIPINSCMNPVLYTASKFIESRRQRKETKLLKEFKEKLKNQLDIERQ